MLLFELHVLVRGSGPFPAAPTGWKRAATVTTTGVYPMQHMYTAHVHAASVLGAMGRVSELEPFLAEHAMTLTRVKIERLFAPDSSNAPEAVSGTEYLEAHIKFADVAPGTFEQLATECLAYGVQMLINPLSAQPLPVTTLRMYNTTLQNFLQTHFSVVCAVSRFATIQRVHLEHGVVDTNPMTDEGWLFPLGGNFQTSITTADAPERVMCPTGGLVTAPLILQPTIESIIETGVFVPSTLGGYKRVLGAQKEILNFGVSCTFARLFENGKDGKTHNMTFVPSNGGLKAISAIENHNRVHGAKVLNIPKDAADFYMACNKNGMCRARVDARTTFEGVSGVKNIPAGSELKIVLEDEGIWVGSEVGHSADPIKGHWGPRFRVVSVKLVASETSSKHRKLDIDEN